MSTPRIVGWSLLGLFIVAAIIFGGWRLNWWFTEQNTNFQSHIIRNSYSNQQTLREEISSKLGVVAQIDTQLTYTRGQERQALFAQRHATLNIVCQDAEQIAGDPLPVDQAQYVAQNCQLGSAK